MGVSKKKRRILSYHGMEFIWWVAPNEEDCDKVYLHIVSADKSIVLSYKVGDGSFVIISEGRTFQGHRTSGKWERYGIPFQEPLMLVTPRDVEMIVAWAVDEREAAPLKV